MPSDFDVRKLTAIMQANIKKAAVVGRRLSAPNFSLASILSKIAGL